MSRERDKKAMDLCNELVDLLNLSTKQKFDLIDRIGELFKVGEEWERLNRKEVE